MKCTCNGFYLQYENKCGCEKGLLLNNINEKIDAKLKEEITHKEKMNIWFKNLNERVEMGIKLLETRPSCANCEHYNGKNKKWCNLINYKFTIVGPEDVTCMKFEWEDKIPEWIK